MVIAGISPAVTAQQQPGIDSLNVIPFDEFFRLLVPPEEVEGRVNLFADWQKGAVFLTQGKFASGIAYNYDVLNNVLLVLVEDKEFSLNPIAVDSILMANSAKVLINPIIINGIGSELLLLRVYDGPHLSLFHNTSAKVADRDINTSAIDTFTYEPKDDIEIDQDQMYSMLVKATDQVIEFHGKKKELKNWENGNQVLDFVKNQNLNLKNETDLIQVVQFYEQVTYVTD